MIRIRAEDLPMEGAGALPPGRGRRGSRGKALAWVALVLGLASILFGGVAVGPVAVIVGIVAAIRADRMEGLARHALIACGGILAGLIGTILWTVLLVHWMDTRTSGGTTAMPAPAPVTSGVLDREAIDQAPGPVRRALTSSASLLVQRRSGEDWVSQGSGSGTFVARQDGRWYVLTCSHVVADVARAPRAFRLGVRWIGGEMRDARVEWTGPAWLDLAVVSTGESEAEGQPSTAPIAANPTLRVGDAVFAIGDPHQYRVSYVIGVLSAVRIITEGAEPLRVIQSQVPLNPGNSGGGLYSVSGDLIAVNSWRAGAAQAEGIGFSIAIDNLWVGIRNAPEAVLRVVEGLRRPATPAAPGGDGAGQPPGH